MNSLFTAAETVDYVKSKNRSVTVAQSGFQNEVVLSTLAQIFPEEYFLEVYE
jgi:hypothetical protein